MPIPPKAPSILVSGVTHQSLELSWEPYHAKLTAALKDDGGKLKAEVQLRKGQSSAWEVVYKGFDTRCSCRGLQDSEQYEARFRFGNDLGWGDFGDAKQVRTERRPFTGEDVHRMLRRGNEVELRQVLETGEASVDAADEKGFSPLMQAALGGKLDLCQLLLDFSANVNWSGDSGKTALMLAANKGMLESVELLLDRGANVNQPDRKGMTSLHYAVDGERAEVIKSLLAAGADASAKDCSGSSSLLRCAMLKNNGNANVAKLLLQAGADPNDSDNTKQCALFYCALHRHVKLAELLLQSGADPRAQNEQGVSVASVADTHDSRAMRQLLEKYSDAKR